MRLSSGSSSTRTATPTRRSICWTGRVKIICCFLTRTSRRTSPQKGSQRDSGRSPHRSVGLAQGRARHRAIRDGCWPGFPRPKRQTTITLIIRRIPCAKKSTAPVTTPIPPKRWPTGSPIRTTPALLTARRCFTAPRQLRWRRSWRLWWRLPPAGGPCPGPYPQPAWRRSACHRWLSVRPLWQ